MDSKQNDENPALRLKSILQRLRENPCPRVPNPPDCKKRASVALILRFRPPAQYLVENKSSRNDETPDVSQSLDDFFDQDWVQQGFPEVLFIKRAARAGDRWTSHVAFPGGKREPYDADDVAASIRETTEEIGLDLDSKSNYLKIGNLPERIITAAWGRKPLMVLCPFIFLQLRYDTPRLQLQPSEVDSIHWVPLYSLLFPSLRTTQTSHVSDRIDPRKHAFLKDLLRPLGGRLVFSAVRLAPTESIIGTDPAEQDKLQGKISTNDSHNGAMHPRATAEQPLLLWGLTLGIVADFLHEIDDKATERLWSWPTFSHIDLRVLTWLLTRSIRNRRLQESRSGDASKNNVGGADSLTYATSSLRQGNQRKGSLAGGHMLEDYFEQLKRAVGLAVGLRLVLGVAIGAWLIRRSRQKP